MVDRQISYRLAFLLLTAACRSDDAEPPANDSGTVRVETRQRASIEHLERDTLSERARILRLLPERDGETVAVLFADTARGIEAGLAISGRAMPTAQLLWPDSVVAVWWSGPHELSFMTRTARGVRVVVDIHAAALEVVERATRPPPAKEADPAEDGVRRRAQLYVDSLYVQPRGEPQQSDMRYIVSAVRMAPDGRRAAFYVIGLDAAGRRVNPAWYALDVPSGDVALIQEVVGAPGDLPEDGAGWTDRGVFLFAKDVGIHEASIHAE